MVVVLAQALDTVNQKVSDLVNAALASLPVVGIAVIVGIVAFVVARVVAGVAHRGLQRSGARPIAVGLLSTLVRGALYFVAALFTLSVAGVPVGSVLGALVVFGLAIGLAIGLAAQEVFGNFIAGLILLWRQPFESGDQIITGDHDGTVDTIDLRVTQLIDYDDDHNQACEVIREAVQAVEGVHDDPPVQVLLTDTPVTIEHDGDGSHDI